MLVRNFKNHSPTPQKYVCVRLPTFANSGGTQLVPLEIVGESAQLMATYARVECTLPAFHCTIYSILLAASRLFLYSLGHGWNTNDTTPIGKIHIRNRLVKFRKVGQLGPISYRC